MIPKAKEAAIEGNRNNFHADALFLDHVFWPNAQCIQIRWLNGSIPLWTSWAFALLILAVRRRSKCGRLGPVFHQCNFPTFGNCCCPERWTPFVVVCVALVSPWARMDSHIRAQPEIYVAEKKRPISNTVRRPPIDTWSVLLPKCGLLPSSPRRLAIWCADTAHKRRKAEKLYITNWCNKQADRTNSCNTITAHAVR